MNYLAEEVDVGQVSTGVLVDVKEVGAWHPPCNRLTGIYHGLGQILQKIYGGYRETVRLSNNPPPSVF